LVRGWGQAWAPLHSTSKDGSLAPRCIDARGEGEPVGEGVGEVVGEVVGEGVGADVGATFGARVGPSEGGAAQNIQGWIRDRQILRREG
jgi:hypothetical protein